MSPETVAALLGAVAGGAFVVLGNVVNQLMEERREQKKFARENASGTAAKAVMQEMLNHRKYTDRTLWALKQRIGGFTDDELRKFLLEIGAQKSGRTDDEWWYLKSRIPERNKRKQAFQAKQKAKSTAAANQAQAHVTTGANAPPESS